MDNREKRIREHLICKSLEMSKSEWMDLFCTMKGFNEFTDGYRSGIQMIGADWDYLDGLRKALNEAHEALGGRVSLRSADPHVGDML
jgi:hypothetical protein